jgi:hypothetical protein
MATSHCLNGFLKMGASTTDCISQRAESIPELLYHEERVRSDHPLRRIAAAIDFKFVREEVAQRYGSKGNVSVDPTPRLRCST